MAKTIIERLQERFEHNTGLIVCLSSQVNLQKIDKDTTITMLILAVKRNRLELLADGLLLFFTKLPQIGLSYCHQTCLFSICDV